MTEKEIKKERLEAARLAWEHDDKINAMKIQSKPETISGSKGYGFFQSSFIAKDSSFVGNFVVRPFMWEKTPNELLDISQKNLSLWHIVKHITVTHDSIIIDEYQIEDSIRKDEFFYNFCVENKDMIISVITNLCKEKLPSKEDYKQTQSIYTSYNHCAFLPKEKIKI